MNNNYNNERLVELYEALLKAGNFETKEELFHFLFESQNELLVRFEEFNESINLRS